MSDLKNPLLGNKATLNDLFEGILTLAVDKTEGAHRHTINKYKTLAGEYPLFGLPGSVKKGYAIFVQPYQELVELLQNKCFNGVIGGFKIIRNAELMKENLLPVYCFDYHRMTSMHIANVSYDEHERFNKELC
jgi:hypothetical protein